MFFATLLTFLDIIYAHRCHLMQRVSLPKNIEKMRYWDELPWQLHPLLEKNLIVLKKQVP